MATDMYDNCDKMKMEMSKRGMTIKEMNESCYICNRHHVVFGCPLPNRFIREAKSEFYSQVEERAREAGYIDD